MQRVEKTVFISYRRATGGPWALAVFQALTTKGYDVFYDYGGIGSGDFEQVILGNIKARAHFLIVLTPTALERCDEPDDWLRREIEMAIDTERNVVPLMMDRFDFATPGVSERLTGTLARLRRYQGVDVPISYFPEAMARLQNCLNVPLSTVLHPPSDVAMKAAARQQAAAQGAPAISESNLTAQQWFERGHASPDLEERLRAYTEAIGLDASFALAYYNRGLARREKGDLDGALRDYDEAIRLDPKSAAAYYDRSVTRREKGDLDGALRDHDEAIRLNPIRHTFEDAAEHYIARYQTKKAIEQETVWLKELSPFIDTLPLDQVNDVTLKPFIDAQRVKVLKGGKIGVKSATLNLKLGVVRLILRLARDSWHDDDGVAWLPGVPVISMVEAGDERKPRQLTWQEQRDHLKKLPPHLARMALFDLQCGVRDEVVCKLRWDWEVPSPAVGIMTFMIPPELTGAYKGKQMPRMLVCNSIARNIIESVRGDHPEYVFVYQHGKRGTPGPIQTMHNTAWQSWRDRCGLHGLNIQDLRHTVRMRLREAGVSETVAEDILWLRDSWRAVWRHAAAPPTSYTPARIVAIFDGLEKIAHEQINLFSPARDAPPS